MNRFSVFGACFLVLTSMLGIFLLFMIVYRQVPHTNFTLSDHVVLGSGDSFKSALTKNVTPELLDYAVLQENGETRVVAAKLEPLGNVVKVVKYKLNDYNPVDTSEAKLGTQEQKVPKELTLSELIIPLGGFSARSLKFSKLGPSNSYLIELFKSNTPMYFPLDYILVKVTDDNYTMYQSESPAKLCTRVQNPEKYELYDDCAKFAAGVEQPLGLKALVTNYTDSSLLEKYLLYTRAGKNYFLNCIASVRNCFVGVMNIQVLDDQQTPTSYVPYVIANGGDFRSHYNYKAVPECFSTWLKPCELEVSYYSRKLTFLNYHYMDFKKPVIVGNGDLLFIHLNALYRIPAE